MSNEYVAPTGALPLFLLGFPRLAPWATIYRAIRRLLRPFKCDAISSYRGLAATKKLSRRNNKLGNSSTPSKGAGPQIVQHEICESCITNTEILLSARRFLLSGFFTPERVRSEAASAAFPEGLVDPAFTPGTKRTEPGGRLNGLLACGFSHLLQADPFQAIANAAWARSDAWLKPMIEKPVKTGFSWSAIRSLA